MSVGRQNISRLLFFLYWCGRPKEGLSRHQTPDSQVRVTCADHVGKRARLVGKAARAHDHFETFLVTGQDSTVTPALLFSGVHPRVASLRDAAMGFPESCRQQQTWQDEGGTGWASNPRLPE